MCCLAAASVEDGIKALWSHCEGQYKWFQWQYIAYNSSFNCATNVRVVHFARQQSRYQLSDIPDVLQTTNPMQYALECFNQYPWKQHDVSNVQDCIQHSTSSGYLDSSSTREVQYQYLVASAFSILWTLCTTLYALLACHIQKTSPELPLRWVKSILHQCDYWNSDLDWCC